MADNTITTAPAYPHEPPEFHSPPPPFGEPPLVAPVQPTANPGQYAPPTGPPPGVAPVATTTAETSAQTSTDPFIDTQQTTTAAAQLQEPPQHPDRPLPTGSLTETPLHSEPAPILPPRPQLPAEAQTPPPPRSSFDQMPDHPALRQSTLGRAQSPPQSAQRVSMTPFQPQPVAPPPQVPVLDANAQNLESDPAIASLHAMFPDFDLLVLQSVLEATGGNRDQAIDSLLAMSDPNYAPTQSHATGGGGAVDPPRQPTQTELDEEFARRLMLEEEQQAHGGAWPPHDQQTYNAPYQTYQPRRSAEQQRPTGGTTGAIGDVANDLQQQFRSFISGTGNRGVGVQGQPQGQNQGTSTGTGYQDQLNRFADTGKKTFNTIFNKVKQKMEDFDRQNPPDTQNMNHPPQSGHWSNWQGPQAQQSSTGPPQHATPIQSPPAASYGALNNNTYGASSNIDTQASLPTTSGRWQYQPEPESSAAPTQPQPQTLAPTTGTGAEEPRRSIDTSRLGLLPKRPVSLMDVNANTRPAAAPAPVRAPEPDSDDDSLEYIDRPVPGAMGRH